MTASLSIILQRGIFQTSFINSFIFSPEMLLHHNSSSSYISDSLTEDVIVKNIKKRYKTSVYCILTMISVECL